MFSVNKAAFLKPCEGNVKGFVIEDNV